MTTDFLLLGMWVNQPIYTQAIQDMGIPAIGTVVYWTLTLTALVAAIL